MVAWGVRGQGVQNQPPGGDLLTVLLPEPGTGRVQGGGLVDQAPGLVQVSGPVGMVGGYGGAVSVHAAAFARAHSWADGALGFCGGAPIVTARRRARFHRGWVASGFVRAAAAAGFLPGRLGTTRNLLCHAVQGLVDLAYPFLCCGEFVGVGEGLADAAARVSDLAAGVLDVGQSAGLACLQLGKTVFQPCHQADGIGAAEAGSGQVDCRAGRTLEAEGDVCRAERAVHVCVDWESAELTEAHTPTQLTGEPGCFPAQGCL